MVTEFVLFDFDGVLANTEESNAAYLEKALSAFGIQDVYKRQGPLCSGILQTASAYQGQQREQSLTMWFCPGSMRQRSRRMFGQVY